MKLFSRFAQNHDGLLFLLIPKEDENIRKKTFHLLTLNWIVSFTSRVNPFKNLTLCKYLQISIILLENISACEENQMQFIDIE